MELEPEGGGLGVGGRGLGVGGWGAEGRGGIYEGLGVGALTHARLRED
jgi:hypothetical protein